MLLKKGEANAAAKAFVDFLKGPESRAIIEKYGYESSARQGELRIAMRSLPSLRAQRSNPAPCTGLDCFVASLLAMTVGDLVMSFGADVGNCSLSPRAGGGSRRAW